MGSDLFALFILLGIITAAAIGGRIWGREGAVMGVLAVALGLWTFWGS